MASSGSGLKLRAATSVLVMAVMVTVLWPVNTHGAGRRPYLALGDSVVFGYITQAGFEYFNSENFVGYPDYVGAKLRFATTNASCPGEATGGFMSSAGADNGCRPFRAAFPLHAAYRSTQLDFATDVLQAHPNTRLVTIGLGANDIFLLQHMCAMAPNPTACFNAGLPGVLATISANVETILFALRATGFHGVLMVVNYYSLDYSDPVGTAVTGLLNQAITAHARANGALIADVFTAFKTAASTAFAGGKPCNAGLLNASPTFSAQNPTCDVHPSQSGQKLLAQTVEQAYRAAVTAEGDDD